MERQRRSF